MKSQRFYYTYTHCKLVQSGFKRRQFRNDREFNPYACNTSKLRSQIEENMRKTTDKDT